jgi:hypothetical protein
MENSSELLLITLRHADIFTSSDTQFATDKHLTREIRDMKTSKLSPAMESTLELFRQECVKHPGGVQWVEGTTRKTIVALLVRGKLKVSRSKPGGYVKLIGEKRARWYQDVWYTVAND